MYGSDMVQTIFIVFPLQLKICDLHDGIRFVPSSFISSTSLLCKDGGGSRCVANCIIFLDVKLKRCYFIVKNNTRIVCDEMKYLRVYFSRKIKESLTRWNGFLDIKTKTNKYDSNNANNMAKQNN